MEQEDYPHSRAMACYSYDSYVDNTFNLRIKDDVQTFAELKKFQRFVIPTPSKKHPLCGGHMLVKKKRHYLSTDSSKVFVLSLIEGVQENIKLGQCFGQYDASNLVATHAGKAKLKQVEVVSPTPANKKVAYDCTWSFISELYNEKERPEDINHLITLMRDRQHKELLFSVHPSLIIEKGRGWCFLRMYEFVKFRANDLVRDQILEKLPYLSDWRNILFQCNVLIETYQHPKADYTRLADYINGKPTTAREKLIHEGNMLIEFIRNGIAHRLERQIRLTPAEHQRIPDVFFPKLSPQMQEAIYDAIGEVEFRKIFMRKEDM